MWWTRQALGFRGWFHVQQSNGSLRTGFVAGDFTVTIRNPANTASSTPAVSESGKGGFYFFDVPSAFLIAQGVGEYGVVIEIDSFAGPSGAPNVRTAVSFVLRVSLQDLDTLATSAALATAQADLDDIQTRLPASLSSGRMRSQVEGMDASTLTAAAVATDAIDADALAASGIAEIQAGLATSAAVAGVQADTDDIQTRLPTSLIGGRMRSHVEAMDADVIGAAQIAAGAITSSEAPALANLDVAVSTRAAPGAAMALTAGAVDDIWDEPIAGHLAVGTTGRALSDAAAGGSSPGAIADAVWDEALAGHLGAGSTGEALDQARDAAVAIDARLPADPADESNQLAAHATTQAAVAVVQSDTDNIQTRLPATLNAGRMRSHVEVMDGDVIGAAQITAGAITSSEAPALANLDVLVSSRAAPGDAMTLTSGERSAVAVAVRDVAIVGSASGSLGQAIQVLQGIAGKSNMRIDNMVYGVTGFLTSCRVRVFPSQATALASTPGGIGQGEIFTITLTGSPDGTFPQLPSTVLGTRP